MFAHPNHHAQQAVHSEVTGRLIDLYARNHLNVLAIWRLKDHGQVSVSHNLLAAPPDQMEAVVSAPSGHLNPLLMCERTRDTTRHAPAPLTGMETIRLIHGSGHGATSLPAEMSLLLEPLLTLAGCGGTRSLSFIVPFQSTGWGQAAVQPVLIGWPDLPTREAIHGDLHLTCTVENGQIGLSEQLFLTSGRICARQSCITRGLQRPLSELLHHVNRRYLQEVLLALSAQPPAGLD